MSGWASGPGRRRVRPRARDAGSATVLVVAAVGVLLAMTVGALMVVSAVVAAHRAHAAADLAALAAAAVTARGEPLGAACAVAARVAARNGGRLVTCEGDAGLGVELRVSVEATLSRVGVASARSRAGPATAPDEGAASAG